MDKLLVAAFFLPLSLYIGRWVNVMAEKGETLSTLSEMDLQYIGGACPGEIIGPHTTNLRLLAKRAENENILSAYYRDVWAVTNGQHTSIALILVFTILSVVAFLILQDVKGHISNIILFYFLQFFCILPPLAVTFWAHMRLSDINTKVKSLIMQSNSI